MNLNYCRMQMIQTFQPLMLGSFREYFKLAPYFSLNLNLQSETRWIVAKTGANQSSGILQHSQNRPTADMVKTLTYDNPDHKIKLKIRQFRVMGKSTEQINNTGYEWYIGR